MPLYTRVTHPRLPYLSPRPPLAPEPRFPLNGLLDTFDRADENPLRNGTWGGTVEFGQDELKIVSNQLTSPDVTGIDGSAYWNTSFAADQEAYLDVAVGSANVGVWLRVKNPGNTSTATGYVSFAQFPQKQLRVFKLTAGHTYTEITPGGATVFPVSTLASGDGIGTSIVGDRIYLWYRRGTPDNGWRLIGTFTDGSISGAGYIGIELDDTTGRADNFGGGEIPPIVVTPPVVTLPRPLRPVLQAVNRSNVI